MPKKKNKKQSSETEKDCSVNVDNVFDEGDNELVEGRKYGRRQIQSNWDRYRPESPKLEEEISKYDDFASLLNVPSDCNYFRFKSEKNWESEVAKSSFGGHKLFNLDLEFLSNGLSCIPFYERVDLDESILSESDIEKCNKRAEECQTRFKPILEKFMMKLECANELPCYDDGEAQVNMNIVKSDERTEHSESFVNLSPKCENNGKFLIKSDVSKNPVQDNIKNICTEGEDLENWLDSVLDD